VSELKQPDQLSELALRVAGGEDHRTEFKSRFPDQARDLAKEIAVFASSNDGLILIGVEDDGTIIGIEDVETNTQRDALLQRVQGICANTIKPPVTPRVEFVTLEGARVLAIDVPKGTAPLYYVQSVAYVRHLTSARAAEPQEVIDLILAWAKRESDEPSAEDRFLSGLVQCLTDVLVNTSEVEIREIDPWREEVRYRLASSSRLRDLALSAPTEFEEFPAALEEISELLDEAAHQDRGIGWGTPD